MHTSRAMVPVACLIAILPALAQDKKGPADNAFYRVQFTIQDGSDPASKTVRTYSMITAANRKAVFKVGDRVPVTAAFQPSGPGVNPIVNTQYLDIGVTIECLIFDLGGKLAMHGNIDLSAVDRHDAKPGAGAANPTVGQTRIELDTAVEPGKPLVVASIDDPVNVRKLQVEATVTKVD